MKLLNSTWLIRHDCMCTCQVGYLPLLLVALRARAEDPTSPIAGALDLQLLAMAGHSRGAKLAALHLAGERPAHSCSLVDCAWRAGSLCCPPPA